MKVVMVTEMACSKRCNIQVSQIKEMLQLQCVAHGVNRAKDKFYISGGAKPHTSMHNERKTF